MSDKHARARRTIATALRGWVATRGGQALHPHDHERLVLAHLTGDYMTAGQLPTTAHQTETRQLRVGPVRAHQQDDGSWHWAQVALLGPDETGDVELVLIAVLSDQPDTPVVSEMYMEPDVQAQLLSWLKEARS